MPFSARCHTALERLGSSAMHQPSPKNPRKIPSYRQRSGSGQAIVTLTDSPTGKRRDYWLGEFNTPASRELYYRLIAEWEGLGRRFPDRPEHRPAHFTAASIRDQAAANERWESGGSAAARPLVGSSEVALRDWTMRAAGGEAPAFDEGADGDLAGDGEAGHPRGQPGRTERTRSRGPRGLGASLVDAPAPGELTISKLIISYWRWTGSNHKFKRAFNIKAALRVLRRLDGSTPALQFGPRKLRILREAMVLGDPTAVPPRKPWSRRTINDRVRVIVTMFRWAVSQELLPPSIPQALAMVEPLKRGRTIAREGEGVGPVPQELIDAVRPLVSRQVRAIIDLQLLTGARPGELLGLRPVDIETSGPGGVWTYHLTEHKNAFRGKDRRIYFGPKAQQVLAGFMAGRSVNATLFSPAEAESERRAAMHACRKVPLSYGNGPGTNKSPSPRRPAGTAYTTDTYRRAIERACEEAFPPPPPLARQDGETLDQWRSRLTPSQRSKLHQWNKEHRWHPHQLRHNAATHIRREFGLEAASLVLGHASATITDAIYAERDQGKIADVIRRCG
jgi:integrase